MIYQMAIINRLMNVPFTLADYLEGQRKKSPVKITHLSDKKEEDRQTRQKSIITVYAKPEEKQQSALHYKPITTKRAPASAIEITKTDEVKPEEKKSKMRGWPENPQALLPYNDIINPLKEVLNKGYRLMRKDEVKSFDYEGFTIGKHERRTHPSPAVRLSKDWLEYENKHGYKLIDVILNITFLMGVEQGRRAERRDSKPLETLLDTLETYREKNKDQRIKIDELETMLEFKGEGLSEEEMKRKIEEALASKRSKRIEELKAELKLDTNKSTFQFKTNMKMRFKELESLARSICKSCTEEQWKRHLSDKGWTYKEWKDRCKKKSVDIVFYIDKDKKS